MPLSGSKVLLIIIIFHLLSSPLSNSLSNKSLIKFYRVLRTRKFENQGQIYQDLLRIRAWKAYIPSAGPFDKKHLKSEVSSEYALCFVLETVRAEVAHYICLLSTMLVLAASKPKGAIGFMLFFFIINMPCILIQRYNRPRFERLLEHRGEAVCFDETEVNVFIRNQGRM